MHAIALTVLATVSIVLVSLQIYVVLRFKLSRASVKRFQRVARVTLPLIAITGAVTLAIAIAPTAAHALFILALAIPSISILYTPSLSAVRITRIARIARASTQRVADNALRPIMHVARATRLV